MSSRHVIRYFKTTFLVGEIAYRIAIPKVKYSLLRPLGTTDRDINYRFYGSPGSPALEKPHAGYKHVKCMTNQNTNVGSRTRQYPVASSVCLYDDGKSSNVCVRSALNCDSVRRCLTHTSSVLTEMEHAFEG